MGRFYENGKTYLCFISETLNVHEYVCILESNLLKFVNDQSLQRWICQNDGAPVHTVKLTRSCLNMKKVDGLEGPAYSPDMNHIPYLWGILSNRMYTNGIQFESFSDLKSCIVEVWNEIENDLL